MLGHLSIVLLLIAVFGVGAQDLSIPLNWQQTSSLQSRDQRIQVAQAGLNYTRTFRYFNLTSTPSNTFTGTFPGFPIWDSANMLWTMALKDRMAGTTDNMNVTDAIRGYGRNFPDYQSKDLTLLTPVNWGMAAMMAYLAYKDEDMLEVAQQNWDYVSQYQVTVDQANSGQHPKRNVTFSGVCHDQSVAGVILDSEKPQDLTAHMMTINHFILLSAHLAEQTHNLTYLSAGKLSANFASATLNDTQLHLMVDDFTLGLPDQPCQVDFTVKKRPHLTGGYMEALSVLGSLDDDPKWHDMAVDLLAVAVRYDWPLGPTGVMNDTFAFTDDDKQYKGKFFRSLYEPMVRMNRTDIQNLVMAFINVQANSILQRATTNGTNFYSSKWTGPPDASFTIAGALASLDVLVAAIGLTPPGSPPSSTIGVVASAPTITSDSTSLTSGRNRMQNVAIGLGVGLPAWVILSSFSVWCFVRRRRQQRQDYSHMRRKFGHHPSLQSYFTRQDSANTTRGLIPAVGTHASPEMYGLDSANATNIDEDPPPSYMANPAIRGL